MNHLLWLILRLLAALLTLLGRRGTRALLAENLLLKQQLLVLRRPRRRAPNLRPTDRLVFGFCCLFLSGRRLIRNAFILKPSTLLRYHRGLKHFKYRWLYSSTPKHSIRVTNPTWRIRPAVNYFQHASG